MRGTSWVFLPIGWVSLLVGAFLGVPMVSSMAKDRDLFEFLPFDAQVVIEVDLQNVSGFKLWLAATDEQKMVHSTWKSLQESYLEGINNSENCRESVVSLLRMSSYHRLVMALCGARCKFGINRKEVARGIAAALSLAWRTQGRSFAEWSLCCGVSGSGMALLGVIENDVPSSSIGCLAFGQLNFPMNSRSFCR
ncbi:MAG: hypothetical protein U0905_06835 [Pirellulales bacterium]